MKQKLGVWIMVGVLAGCAGFGDYGKGKTLFEKGYYERAAGYFEKSIKKGKKVVDSHIYLGRIYGVQGKYIEGIREVEEALKENPDSPGAHFVVALLYGLYGDSSREDYHLQKVQDLGGRGPGTVATVVMAMKQKELPEIMDKIRVEFLKGKREG